MMEAMEKADITISIDCDGQDDINAMDEMMKNYHEGCHIVYGVRSKRETDTFFKRVTAEGFYKFMHIMGAETVFNHADYRLMSKQALEGLAQFKEVNLFLRGQVPMVGYKSTAVYYERYERIAGESHYPFSKMLSFAIDGITSFSIKPLRLITSSGVLFIFVALAIICYALYEYAVGHVVPGWTSLLVSLWFIGGAILTAIGVIGEYIGKIYREVKRRPRYFVEKMANIE